MIPDAPYIREAELYGMPGPEEIECPCCGKLCKKIYTEASDWEAIGCENCIKERESWEWIEMIREINKEEDKDD
ncbi:MAG: hypothetical protein J6Y48_08550 [Clostridia bacterium]|nr:hypothetical protein [Clostridia bacterium]